MLAEEIIPGGKFTQPQLELLRMFSRQYPDKVWYEIKDLLSRYFINVVRISLVLLAASKRWKYPLGWDHHTWFNIAAYGIIFLMIWFYDKSVEERKINTTK